MFKAYTPLTVRIFYVEEANGYTYNCWAASILGWGLGDSLVWSDTAEGALRKAKKKWGDSLEHTSDCECPECMEGRES